MKQSGYFITFSGIDGSGKTTIINKLLKYLGTRYDFHNKIKMLDGMKPGKYNQPLRDCAGKLGTDMFSLFGGLVPISFAADLNRILNKEIIPALNEGHLVITHRNDLCCKAYSKLRDIDGQAMEIVNPMIANYPKPDIHIFLDIKPEIALDRIYRRQKILKKKLSINENSVFLEKVSENYHNLITSDYNDVVIVNTSDKCIDESFMEIADIIDHKIHRVDSKIIPKEK